MKLTRLEKQLLRFVEEKFPIEWEKTPQEYQTKEEKPLVTEEEIKAQFPKQNATDVSAAIKKLCTFLLIKKEYLYVTTDFIEVATSPGSIIRMPGAKTGDGVDGYQVTKLGKETIAEFWREKGKKVLMSWGQQLAEKYGLHILMFLGGILFS